MRKDRKLKGKRGLEMGNHGGFTSSSRSTRNIS